MQPNKKYELNGTQYAMYPNQIMNITQSINGAYSHRGTNAIDDAQSDTGRSNGYAPCDMVCVATDYGNAYGNAMFWQSQNPVITRSHGTQYIHMMVIHDDTANAYVGMKIPQGNQLFTEGTAGNATGNHNHIEVALGKFSGTHYVVSGQKTAWGTTVYMMPNNINPSEVFFVDDTNILNGGGLNWGKIPQGSSSLSYDEMEDETYAVRFKNDTPIVIHKDSTTGANFGTFVSGETQVYQKKGAWNGHRWIGFKATINGTEYKCVCAISGSEVRGEDMWVDLIDPSELETQPTEQPTEQPKEDEPTPSYTDHVKLYGVDLSEHNKDIDVSQYDYAILRCAWGENTDTLFESYVEKCEKANVPYGVYIYDYALTDDQAIAEAEYVIDLIKDKNIQMGVWFDMEDADGYKAKNNILTKERCSSSCKIFCDKLKEEGYYVGIYTSSSWIGTYVDTTYPLWVANWGSNDGTIQSDQSSVGVMHQYTSDPLDKDVSYHDVDFFASTPKDDTTDEKPHDQDGNSGTDDTSKNTNTLLKLLIKLVRAILKIFTK